MFQQDPMLSFKLCSIQLPIIKARSILVCFNLNPIYLSIYLSIWQPKFLFWIIFLFVYLLVIFTFYYFFIDFDGLVNHHHWILNQSIFQALFDSIANYQGLKLRLLTQPGPALNATQGHKHPIDIRLTLRLVHKPYLNLYFNKDPNYLSNYRFNFQLYVTTRTQAIFQAIFDSMLNKLAKIYACMFQQEPKLTFKHNLLVIRKCKSQILINSRYSIA